MTDDVCEARRIRAAVQVNPYLYEWRLRGTIQNYLWSDDSGLPVDSEDDVQDRAEEVCRHVYLV